MNTVAKTWFVWCFVVICIAGCDRPLTFDERGEAHGTGEKIYKYKSGSVKLREAYEDGELVRSRWFKPDGTLIQETQWFSGSGEGIYLREDGSIARRIQYAKGLAEGEAVDYDAAGNVVARKMYSAGVPASRPAN
jgi:antitoxin component YwqK of YwqJK toxin-antitoxin module